MKLKSILLVSILTFQLTIFAQNGTSCEESFTVTPQEECEQQNYSFQSASQQEMWFNFIAPPEDIVEIILDTAFVNNLLSEIVVYEFSNGSTDCNDTILVTTFQPGNGGFELNNLIEGNFYSFKIVSSPSDESVRLRSLRMCLEARVCCSIDVDLLDSNGDIVLPDITDVIIVDFYPIEDYTYFVCEDSEFTLDYAIYNA